MDTKGRKDRMKRARCAIPVAALLLAFLWAVAAAGTEAEIYFSADKSGESRVTKIQEGDQIWIVVSDPDQDIDCDVRDKVWTDVKVVDAKTGAHIVWKSYIDRFGADTDGDGSGEAQFGDPAYAPHKGHWPGPSAGWLGADFLEETNRSTGLFVSSRPFQIGSRVAYTSDGTDQAHIAGRYEGPRTGVVEPVDFEWGGYLYAAGNPADHPGSQENYGDDRVWVNAHVADPAIPQWTEATLPGKAIPLGDAYLPPGTTAATNDTDYMLGRFENMDTIVGLYVDPMDPSDVALGRAKLNDTEAEVRWDEEIYPDGNEAATITVTDPDENLNCSKVEMVPVFVIVNPGSWNWMAGSSVSPAFATSASDFWALNRFGGVQDLDGTPMGDPANPDGQPLIWCNVYSSGLTTARVNLGSDGSRQPNEDGTYYIHYPTEEDELPVAFDTATRRGVTRVMFYATETSASSGVFTLRLNSILRDLGFKTLDVRDVLVAYYIDPNDQDDFKLATAYIGEHNHSEVRFTTGSGETETEFWIGRDPVYVEVTDANANVEACCPERVVVQICDPHEVDDTEWLILDETSSNSPVFLTNAGLSLSPVWDALGIGDPGMNGGYSLKLDNWDLEVFNEDSVYVRYNDVIYADAALEELGDQNIETSFPPIIESARVDNDVALAVLEVADTQVYDGDTVNMRFLDRQGNPVSGYANSDCVFIQVIDPDQDEDRSRRERIAGYWDGTAGQGQNIPFGPMDFPTNHASCGFLDVDTHLVNDLLGDTNIVREGSTWPKLYVLNPRNGRWAPFDLLETGIDTGEFVSVTCIDLVTQYPCVPSLGVLPGDTILAAYQDPSNHSDYVWISIKVSVGGAEPVGLSTTSFVDAVGNPVAAYVEGDPVYVRVEDPTLAGAGTINDAVTIAGVAYDLAPLAGAAPGSFVTVGLDLHGRPGDTITAAYVDPTDPTDASSATVRIVAGELRVDRFYAGPSPADGEVTFGFIGQGLADLFTAAVYDLQGHLVWSGEVLNALVVVWDGRSEGGTLVANGAYVYVVSASSATDGFSGKGTIFIRR